MINTLQDNISKLKSEVESDITSVVDFKSLESFRIKYLGEKSFLVAKQKEIKNVSPGERPEYGKILNELR